MLGIALIGVACARESQTADFGLLEAEQGLCPQLHFQLHPQVWIGNPRLRSLGDMLTNWKPPSPPWRLMTPPTARGRPIDESAVTHASRPPPPNATADSTTSLPNHGAAKLGRLHNRADPSNEDPPEFWLTSYSTYIVAIAAAAFGLLMLYIDQHHDLPRLTAAKTSTCAIMLKNGAACPGPDKCLLATPIAGCAAAAAAKAPPQREAA